MSEAVLVTGGAGYIGSHVVKDLAAAGYRPVVLDNLSTGHRSAVPAQVAFYQGDIGDKQLVRDVVTGQGIKAVVHLAAKSLVGESMHSPELYYDNNLRQAVSFLGALREVGVESLVFSSSAGVYGTPQEIPISEEAPLRPESVYAQTKLMVEQILRDYQRAYGLRWIALRYFNAAGADLDGELGEDHSPETHLIPNALRAALGTGPILTVHGTDYPTLDGTCIRDYVHVSDLARAHTLAVGRLLRGEPGGCYNLGSACGYSVKEIIEAVQAVTGLTVPVQYGPRRPGDPPILVAGLEKAKTELGWQPQHSDLSSMVHTARRWCELHPNGYADQQSN